MHLRTFENVFLNNNAKLILTQNNFLRFKLCFVGFKSSSPDFFLCVCVCSCLFEYTLHQRSLYHYQGAAGELEAEPKQQTGQSLNAIRIKYWQTTTSTQL